ncbi:MAG: tetratricopeptide repeat protein [Candidatus Latescibacteria bacterium]|nr:tetratricopeptide repeat protein [Candidatus Latescibacterota bacterium]
MFESSRYLTLIVLLVLPALVAARDAIPLTTASEEARTLYLQGRDLAEKLRNQEAAQLYQQALAADPECGLCYLSAALVQPSFKGFFAYLDQAEARLDQVSQGERLWIKGLVAGANGRPQEQRQHYSELVELHPGDPRAHNLLGNHHFGQQNYPQAIAAYEKALAIDPEFSPIYNQLGYAQRFLGNYSAAEAAFGRYIELIPDDPNPYDSYAELLLKMGRYQDSIASYHRALAQDPHFVASYLGIATNLNYLGRHAEAQTQLDTLFAGARNDGERRAALFAQAVSYADQGDLDSALAHFAKQAEIATANEDAGGLSADLINMGTLLLELGRLDAAAAQFARSLAVVEEADLGDAVKDNTRRAHLFNLGRLALAQGNTALARQQAEQLMQRAQALHNTAQTRLAHQLEGMIALQTDQPDKALAHLRQANQQDPYNLYRMAQAYQQAGLLDQARQQADQAADFNALNNLNHALSRHRARQLAEVQ